MDPTNDLLAECQRHFPGLDWEAQGDRECTAYIPTFVWTQRLTVYTHENGVFDVLVLAPAGDTTICHGRWSGPNALALAAAHWRHFAAEAACLVAAPPEYKPSPEAQQQSDVPLIAYLLEGQRRKDLNLPPDPDAQLQAAAEAIAEVEAANP